MLEISRPTINAERQTAASASVFLLDVFALIVRPRLVLIREMRRAPVVRLFRRADTSETAGGDPHGQRAAPSAIMQFHDYLFQ
ncbi:hypothetical protein [Mesorhizobium sp.]|uniref:hypothetical protein n=1 Tax=Mesorhizobium sp. TaxID=1871066 RepID=UPI0025BD159A|nr:hypothetical protein [Mesorhizobium sp.]